VSKRFVNSAVGVCSLHSTDAFSRRKYAWSSNTHAEVFISIISNVLHISSDELTNHYSRM